MKAQSFLYQLGEEKVPDKRTKRGTRTIKIYTHINKSRPGRKIREAKASAAQE
jgi:hypothetical protein